MSVTLKPYPEYKNSGVSWLGEIPEHWKILRAKYVFREIDERSTKGEETHLSMSQRYGLIESYKIDDWRLQSENYVGGKLCKKNDLVLNRLKAHLGVFAHAPQCGVVSPDYTVFRPVRADEARFFELVFKTPIYITELRRSTKGIVEGFWRLYTDDFYDLRVPVPPQSEQCVILSWVEQFDRQFRRLIRAKQRLIQLLHEQKQATIHWVVTHGLAPHARLKPSGIDWLGDVPAHWEVCRLRHLISRVTSGSRGWSDYAATEGPLFLRVGNLTRDSIELRLDNIVHLDLPSTSEAYRTHVQAGDVLVSITGYIGSIAVVPPNFSEAYVSQHVALCRPKDQHQNSRWLGYVLLSPVGQGHGQISLYGGTKDGLSLDDVKNYPILLPPRSEQDLIVGHLDSKLEEVSLNQEGICREIALLREYRTRLITDVVTGKLDVRDVELPALDEAEALDGFDSGEDFEAEEIDHSEETEMVVQEDEA
jgi:type I restriction enzyme S subunit